MDKTHNSQDHQLEISFGLEAKKRNSHFRPIHYLGSKLRIANFIEQVIDSIEPEGHAVCDLFAGSGTVSFKLSYKRQVFAVDIQEYSRVLCSALLNTNAPHKLVASLSHECSESQRKKDLFWAIQTLSDYEDKCIESASQGHLESLCDLLEHGSIISYELGDFNGRSELGCAIRETIERLKSLKLLQNSDALAIRYFGGLYYSYRQCAQIDVLLHFIHQLDKEYRDTFLAALLSTMSDNVNTVGKQFAQPIRPRKADGKPKSLLKNKVAKDRSIDIIYEYNKWLQRYCLITPSGHNHSIKRMDYIDALDNLSSDVKVIYADPPYTRDHYSRFYHTLETVCLRDMPRISTMKVNGRIQISRGIYREDRHQSPFCIKSKAPAAFEELFLKASRKKCSLVLSYSPFDEQKKVHPRLLTIARLKALAEKYYNDIEVLSPGKFVHSKLTHSEKHLESSAQAEVLLIFTNPL